MDRYMNESVDRFLHYITVERGLSPNTLAAYRNDLNQLVEYLASRNGVSEGRDPWAHVNDQTIASYVLWLHELGYSDTTRARKVASTKSMFSFFVDEGIVATDPTEYLSSPRVGRSLPEPLSAEEVERLLIAQPGDTTPESLRDRAMLELIYATGMRVSELVSLDLDDLDLDGAAVRCLGKGGKERVIPIHSRAVNAVRGYLQEARPRFVGKLSGRG